MYGLQRTAGLLFFPAAILFAAILEAPSQVSFGSLSHAALVLIPYAALVFAMLLSWRFNRGRAMFSLVMLALVFSTLQFIPALGWHNKTGISHSLINTYAVLALLLTACFRERGLFSRRGPSLT